ncbi:MAG: hypothetical protein R3C16_09635 [Hyphomonadaceae bacterium]
MDGQTLLLANDAVLLGALAIILGFVFWTSESNAPFWKGFYRIFRRSCWRISCRRC